MNRLWISLLIVCVVDCSWAQSCIPNYIFFKSQEQIDLFPTQYPGCVNIEGQVFIDDEDIGNINNLNALSQIEAIQGNLFIGNCDSLKDLKGLEHLEFIGGELAIQDIEQLTNLSDLASLQFVFSISLWFNTLLKDLSIFQNWTEISGDISIRENPSLTDLNALENVDSVGGFVGLHNNISLHDLNGFKSLRTINGDFWIDGHPLITNLHGLDSLKQVNGGIGIHNNNALISLEGLRLSTIGRGLYISNNPLLTNLHGLENFTSTNGTVGFSDNPQLNSLDGIENLNYVGEGFELINNPILKNIHALNQLQFIHGWLFIDNNDSLMSIRDLKNAEMDLFQLQILNSDHLADCAIEPICTYLLNPLHDAEINANATGCNSREEILTICDSLHVDVSGNIPNSSFRIFPNPVSDILNIESVLLFEADVFDMLGKKVDNFSSALPSFDVSTIAPGQYVVLVHLQKEIIPIRFQKL